MSQMFRYYYYYYYCCDNVTGDRYCSQLVSEGGIEIIRRLLSCPTTHPRAIEIASDVLRMVSAKLPESVLNV